MKTRVLAPAIGCRILLPVSCPQGILAGDETVFAYKSGQGAIPAYEGTRSSVPGQQGIASGSGRILARSSTDGKRLAGTYSFRFTLRFNPV